MDTRTQNQTAQDNNRTSDGRWTTRRFDEAAGGLATLSDGVLDETARLEELVSDAKLQIAAADRRPYDPSTARALATTRVVAAAALVRANHPAVATIVLAQHESVGDVYNFVSARDRDGNEVSIGEDNETLEDFGIGLDPEGARQAPGTTRVPSGLFYSDHALSIDVDQALAGHKPIVQP
jgi:hypothetical protein